MELVEFFRHYDRAFKLLVAWLRGHRPIATGVPIVEPLPARTLVVVTYHGDLDLTLVSGNARGDGLVPTQPAH